jgi:hypothetical protein
VAYEITIIEKRLVKKLVGNDYAVIGQKEVEREARFYGAEPEGSKTRITDEYGYTPEIEKLVPEERTVLKQQVDELDLKAVIKAINGI